jgi:hypothetical protein
VTSNRKIWTFLRLLTAAGGAALACAGVALGEASHAGWPECMRYGHYQCAGAYFRNTSDAEKTVHGDLGEHNELLGGNGNDTLYGGNAGDVIWGDYKPSGQPSTQRDFLHGGSGDDWIYASHGFNEIWTGAGNDNIALVYGYGTVHCNGPGVKTLVVRYLPQNRRYKLIGCDHKVLQLYRA